MAVHVCVEIDKEAIHAVLKAFPAEQQKLKSSCETPWIERQSLI